MTRSEMTVEQARNRLLRRVDWRFLLPCPSPKRSVCFARGELADAVELVSERVADWRDPQASNCDLAVAVDPDSSTLRAAYTALRPGGSLYVEWYSRFLGAAAARRRLEAAGFEAILLFAPQSNPSRTRPEQWIPLDASGARSHIVRHRAPARRWLGRIRRRVRDAIWRSGPQWRLLAPICAIAARPSVPTSSAASGLSSRVPGGGANEAATGSHPCWRSALGGAIESHWAEWGWGERPERISSLLLTGGRRSINKVVALVFAGVEPSPRLAVKIARVPESVPGLQQEVETLRALERSDGGIRGVPKVLFCERHDRLLMVGETIVSGRRLSGVLTPHNVHELADSATAWQLALADGTLQRPGDEWHARLIEPVIGNFDESFGAAVDPGMLREATDAVRGLRPLSVVCEQRDFAPWNLLVTSHDGLGVLDWESSEPRGVPALDLIYLLTYLAIYLDGAHGTGRYGDSYRGTLTSSTRIGEIATECLARYGRSTGVTPAELRPLRLLTWMLHSRSSYQQLAADVAGRPEAEQLRRALFIQLWEAEMRYGDRAS